MKTTQQQPLYLLLASMSRYRAQCLEKLQIDFDQWAPNIDESLRPDEQPQEMVIRLAIAKATAALQSPSLRNQTHIVASDQTLVCKNQVLGKPHTLDRAKQQLALLSGDVAYFYTSLCVLDVKTHQYKTALDQTKVVFRTLSNTQIAKYLALDTPLDCAGSFKSELAGITLCHSIEGKDPNALVGLPLICLTDILEEFGHRIL